MACVLTAGQALGCKDYIGGVQKVYIGEWNDDTMTMTMQGDPTYSITEFAGATVSFYEFEQEAETADFSFPGTFGEGPTPGFFTSTLIITLAKLDSSIRNKVRILSQGKWRIIVKDNNGKYWFMGYINPVRVTAVDSRAGKMLGDTPGYTLTFTVKEPVPPYEVESTAALSVIATV